MFCGTDWQDAGHVRLIFTPTGPGVVSHVGNYACGDRILVDIPQQRGEILHIVDRFALETILKEMARVLIMLVEILCIGYSDAFHGSCQPFVQLSNQQMYMIRHQTIGVYDAMRRQRFPVLVFRKCLLFHQTYELPVVLARLEDVLPVDTSQHHVVNSRSALLSQLSWHKLSYCIDFAKV